MLPCWQLTLTQNGLRAVLYLPDLSPFPCPDLFTTLYPNLRTPRLLSYTLPPSSPQPLTSPPLYKTS